ncbi:RNA polymerase sigma factor [Parapedobacter pyrenivorans]|uniref:RNA polymerase sigma factor n=1 Tax=Parapedobacter pyrenivorans TaxID=1305674 RepID=UPI0033407F85
MSTYSAIDERDLLLQVAAGNERAFDALYRLYSGKVYAFAFRILRSEVLAEEVVQETLLKLWLSGRETANIANLNGYMRTVARNASLNLLRRQEIERRAEQSLAADLQEGHHDTEERVLFNEAKEMLEDAVGLLPPKQQEAFRLCHMQGLGYKEAADLMGISPQTVAVHMKLALRFVRSYLEKATNILAILVALRLF